MYKENLSGNITIKDLNSNKKYSCTMPLKTGAIFVEASTFESFNEVTGNTKNHLTKRKIKKIGNSNLYL